MNIVVTGVTGFIGRNLLLQLLQGPTYEKIYVSVRNLEKLRAQFLGDGFEKIPEKVIPFSSSSSDWNIPNPESIDDLVHCAGSLFAREYREFHDINVEGTLKLLQAFPKLRRVVVLSSQAASGPCAKGQNIKNEEDTELPITFYGNSKLEMERQVVKHFPHLPIVFLRPPMVLGPRDKASLPLFKLAKSVLRPKPGIRSKYYSFISVNDLILAILSVLKAPELPQNSASYFVASSEVFSDKDLIRAAAKTVQREGFTFSFPQVLLKAISKASEQIPLIAEKIPSLSPDRIKEIFPERWVVSAEKFEKAFQWKAAQNLLNTLQETKDWYVKSGFLKV